MAVSVLLVLLNILIFVTTVVTITYVIPYRKMAPIRWLLLLSASFCVVSFCTLVVYVSDDFHTKTLFARFRFFGLGLMTPAWLLFLSTVFGRWNWLQKRLVTGAVFLPGVCTFLFTLIPPCRDWVVTDFKEYSAYGLVTAQYSGGAWFMLHYVWAMSLVMTSLILGIYIFVKESGIRRRQVSVLLAGSILAAAVDIYCVLTNSPLRWMMISSGTFLLSQAGIIYAVLAHRLLNVAPLAMMRIFQNLPDPVIVVDNLNVIRGANKAALRVFGLVKDVVGQNIEDALPKISLSAGELSIADEFDDVHFFNLSIERLDHETNNESGRILFFRQITVQKGIEARLNENMEFKARLLALIAHDLSGYMEGQMLLSQSIQDDLSLELRNRTDMLIDSTFASKGFVNNIMSWVKTQGNSFEVIKRPFEWNALISECIEQVATQAKMRKVVLTFESNCRPLVTDGDSEMLSSVVRNLLWNAIRASSEGSVIFVSLMIVKGEVDVVVKDQGVGMTNEQLEALRFSSGSFALNDYSKGQGFGIGLMIVRHFIKLHGGTFLISSDLGVGTEVSFRIPL
ncbi:histidine kinase N-terminal 7TM domain-containing protein [Bdellovibrio sp. ZAP7]|uniref:histidine kinase N-terminal 7TM domain-containing protein n=1 Tax=Bdellovibrio sp. ZAP7 TaxID=2231053 RepID=UPI00143DF385|nr:histidine kinase N-terminal 7TM domain-containing protein [Bdellovibrio sp. ZAP7]